MKIKGSEMPSGHETILLVDDEKTILSIVREMLGQLGYTILTTESGEEGLDLFKIERERIDLVILDLSMPGMDGQECLKQLLEIDSKLKVIIASGFSASRRIKETMKMGAKGFIAKPYSLTDLAKEVREVCDAK